MTLLSKTRRPVYSKLFFISFIFVILFIQGLSLAAAKDIPRIDLIENSIYLDGRKFLIKGIGYSPYRPGQTPGSPVSLEIVEADFKRIKEAGFNTLRVWDIMPPAQLELAEKYGLKVIQAAYLSPDVNFGYSGYKYMAMTKVKEMCRLSKKHPNVIMYLLMNEPHADAVIKSGVDETINLYKQLVEIVKKEDPGRPVSMANAYWTLWLDQSMWDVVSFNVYNYIPLSVRDIGYANFIKNLKSFHAAEKPFVVTEFGLSVSPEGEGAGDYGGNTQKEQAEVIINNFRNLIEAGAAGGCVFEWNDEWWKAGDPTSHNGHPEEWFGIIGIENKGNLLGKPRKAYYSLKEELKFVLTKPREGHRMLGKAEIEVNASSEISDVQYRIDDGKWKVLAKTDDWWKGIIDARDMKPGLHILTVKGLDKGGEITRSLHIIKCKNEKEMSPPINVELTTDKPSYKNGDMMEIKARLTDREGVPLGGHCIKMGVFDSTDSYLRHWESYTDKNGFFSRTIPVIGNLTQWYYVCWAGTEIEDYGRKIKQGKISYIKAEKGEGFPVKWLVAKKAKKIKLDGKIEKAWLKADKVKIGIDTNYAEADIDSSEDLSAEVRVLWDEKHIYLLADVLDDIPMRNKNREINLWNGDCIELFVSIDPNKIPERGYSGSDFQILIGTNGKMWISGQAKGGLRNSRPVSSKAVAKKTDAGYTLEAKINIANFKEEPLKIFKKGDILGFDIAIGDGDGKGVREGKLIWNGTPKGYMDSAVWGRVKLE